MRVENALTADRKKPRKVFRITRGSSGTEFHWWRKFCPPFSGTQFDATGTEARRGGERRRTGGQREPKWLNLLEL